ncbi:MAG: hypothetical protein EOS23_31365 [Mesorhizobium sp.]|jgi:hypothetical protein|uniref:hypothetical protein n=1 Tax=unclassified Mesorhizobium TaxID=325217 RepID=UPI000494B35C|nr:MULTISPECIES: hypothetical protein [Mesorhizobium]RUV88659.1 hypothetical protein EOA88_13760 [Mesorhizobium sp. M5C.F.Ca.IN.020.14.1.1]RUV28075.1 hypothetical protein EOA86_21285 [Mesorhizobium sp. M5C.F.Ca.IN.020.32.2.1]RWD40014.1 MAG: hypothetical protein EOS59_31210 [Mesorhizobium sp.]RWE06299.1 MAG: hypothetical protein EOS23_31365 [Mesorhizobium sp.]RWE51882.1 MAG: hypothetical protein EOS24_31795 [Mesorhizobium sp.]
MSLDRDWDSIRPDRSFAVHAGMGILRITLLFGSAVVALALIATPLLDSRTRLQTARDHFAGGLDGMSTGSIGSPGSVGSTGSIGNTGSIGHRGTYTLRRSVLQPLPSSVCVIRDNGKRSGDC